jgi:hypothetical protein
MPPLLEPVAPAGSSLLEQFCTAIQTLEDYGPLGPTITSKFYYQGAASYCNNMETPIAGKIKLSFQQAPPLCP